VTRDRVAPVPVSVHPLSCAEPVSDAPLAGDGRDVSPGLCREGCSRTAGRRSRPAACGRV